MCSSTGYADASVVKASAAALMGGCWRAVALKTLFVGNLADFKVGRGLFNMGKVVLFALKIFPAFFVAQHGSLIGHMPIVIDRQGMALITATRRGNCLPGRKHGASGTESESGGADKYKEFFHELYSKVRWQHYYMAE